MILYYRRPILGMWQFSAYKGDPCGKLSLEEKQLIVDLLDNCPDADLHQDETSVNAYDIVDWLGDQAPNSSFFRYIRYSFFIKHLNIEILRPDDLSLALRTANEVIKANKLVLPYTEVKNRDGDLYIAFIDPNRLPYHGKRVEFVLSQNELPLYPRDLRDPMCYDRIPYVYPTDTDDALLKKYREVVAKKSQGGDDQCRL